MNEKKAKRQRIEARIKRDIRYQRALIRWEESKPPKRRIFKYIKWRLSKPKWRG